MGEFQLRGAGRISLLLGTETILIYDCWASWTLLKKVKQEGNCRYITCSTSVPLLDLSRGSWSKKSSCSPVYCSFLFLLWLLMLLIGSTECLVLQSPKVTWSWFDLKVVQQLSKHCRNRSDCIFGQLKGFLHFGLARDVHLLPNTFWQIKLVLNTPVFPFYWLIWLILH